MGNHHAKEPGQEPQPSEVAPEKPASRLSNMLKNPKIKARWQTGVKISYVLIGVATVLFSLGLIAVSVITAMANKIFTTEQSGRVVGLILLAVSAAVTLCATLYAAIAMFKTQSKHLRAAAAVLAVLAVIQAIIIGVAIRVTDEDEATLTKSMKESFRLSKEGNPRYHKIWATTQYELDCCGVYSADDYRSPRVPLYFPPDVPVSCCPAYDPNRSELVQEAARAICKSRKTYYNIGCRHLVLEMMRNSATSVLAVTIVLIVLQVIGVSFISIISNQKEKEELSEKPKTLEEGDAAHQTPEHSKSKHPVKS